MSQRPLRLPRRVPLLAFLSHVACVDPVGSAGERDPVPVSIQSDGLVLDPKTGVPYAPVFQIPISGFTVKDFSFGFGGINMHFCLETSGSECKAYGAHLGRDTNVAKTPVGTAVVAPADGIVRLSTNTVYGGYGSDSKANSAYPGCLLVLEHARPGGDPVLSLLGHLACDSGVPYDPGARLGNPSVGSVVRRGQYVGKVAHYWSGSTQTKDWHHLHWAMRRGPFDPGLPAASFVAGYDKPSAFDEEDGLPTHPVWIDPFRVLDAHVGAAPVSSEVRRHPPGSLLEAPDGERWLVSADGRIAFLSADVFIADRYDEASVIRVSAEEMECYAKDPPRTASGPVELYQRPGTKTVVMAYPWAKTRYDVIRWEAFLSWGFDASTPLLPSVQAQTIEAGYANAGYRRLRPGALVKGAGHPEVAMVTPWQTRWPIVSAEVFEALGFAWERVVEIPDETLDAVAGPREDRMVDAAYAVSCLPAVPCSGTCGGGGEPSPAVEACNGIDDDGDGEIDEIFLCPLGMLGPVCLTACGSMGRQRCDPPSCQWGACIPGSEQCSNILDDDCDGAIDCADPECVAYPGCIPGPGSGGSGGAVGVAGFGGVSSAGMPGGESGSTGSVLPSGGTGSGGSAAGAVGFPGGSSGFGGLATGGFTAAGSAGSFGGMASSSSGGSSGLGGAGGCVVVPGPPGSGGTGFFGGTTLRLAYAGPAKPGPLAFWAWWQPPLVAPHPWEPVPACADPVSGDGMLDCVLPIEHGSTSFEFQVFFADGSIWGDTSCVPGGGCGAPVGMLQLFDACDAPVAFEMLPNHPGEPWLKGRIGYVP